ncbi:MAG: hypothetical protein ACK4I8_02315 [Armatimonadota bacterium]
MGGRGSCRAVISASRQFGRLVVGSSANRQFGNLASQQFVNSGCRQKSRLVIGELTIVSACIPRPPPRVPRPNEFRLTRMFALQNGKILRLIVLMAFAFEFRS